MNCCLQEIYYTSIYIFYILLFISRQVQKSKNYENTTSTPKVTSKTIFIICLNSFVFVIRLNLKQLVKHD